MTAQTAPAASLADVTAPALLTLLGESRRALESEKRHRANAENRGNATWPHDNVIERYTRRVDALVAEAERRGIAEGVQGYPFQSVAAVRAANRSVGQYFFSPGALRHFSSRIGRTLYAGRYFVTSEHDTYSDAPRTWSVRAVEPDATIETLDDHWQKYTSDAAARAAAKALGEAWNAELTQALHVLADVTDET